jgi:hypothetical protein
MDWKVRVGKGSPPERARALEEPGLPAGAPEERMSYEEDIESSPGLQDLCQPSRIASCKRYTIYCNFFNLNFLNKIKSLSNPHKNKPANRMLFGKKNYLDQ